MIEELLSKQVSVSEIADRLAQQTSVTRNRIYKIALNLKNGIR